MKLFFKLFEVGNIQHSTIYHWHNRIFSLIYACLKQGISLTSKNRQASSCKLRFGVTHLNNTSLIEKFFPEDLPEDWRLAYYSNEFQLLLSSLSELPFSTPLETMTTTPDEIIEELTQFSDDLGDDFFLLTDISMLAENTQQILFDIQKKGFNLCHFINLDKMNEAAKKMDCGTKFGCLLSEIISIENKETEKWGESLLCIVNTQQENMQENEQKIAAIELRKLIEKISLYAISKGYESVNILFSSAHNALENCRNAILLESMM